MAMMAGTRCIVLAGRGWISITFGHVSWGVTDGRLCTACYGSLLQFWGKILGAGMSNQKGRDPNGPQLDIFMSDKEGLELVTHPA
jgi:hypothetical protein